MPSPRRWSFTLNNPKEHSGKKLRSLLKEMTTYFIIGKENFTKESEGTPHYQGYAVFRNPISAKKLKALHFSTHWEPSGGSHQENIDYCSKEDKNPLIVDNNHQGERIDLVALYQLIKGGATVEDILDLDPGTYMRNHNVIDKLIDRRLRRRGPQDPAPIIHWYYGPPGTGKTRSVFDQDPTWENIYVVDNSNDWTGYTQQRIILIDEFHEGMISYRRLLRLIDRYPIQMNKKFGSVHIRSPHIYITSEHHPLYAFSDLQPTDNIQALIRRITEIKPFGNAWIEETPLKECDSDSSLDSKTHYPKQKYGLDQVIQWQEESSDASEI